MRFARRRAELLLAGLSLAAAGIDFECSAGVSWDTHPQCYTSVLVIGGGVSGLAAARTLQDNWEAYGAGSSERTPMGGLRITVLEARDRVGGRVWSNTEGKIAGAVGNEVDMGASWIYRSTVEDPIEQIARIIDSSDGDAGIFGSDRSKNTYRECGPAAAVEHTCSDTDPRRQHCEPVTGCEAVSAADTEAAGIAFAALRDQARARVLKEHQNRNGPFPRSSSRSHSHRAEPPVP